MRLFEIARPPTKIRGSRDRQHTGGAPFVVWLIPTRRLVRRGSSQARNRACPFRCAEHAGGR